jgi:hypothetical protein
MKRIVSTKDSSHSSVFVPYTIPRAIFNGLSPLDKIAAVALEMCGKVVILDVDEGGLYV